MRERIKRKVVTRSEGRAETIAKRHQKPSDDHAPGIANASHVEKVSGRNTQDQDAAGKGKKRECAQWHILEQLEISIALKDLLVMPLGKLERTKRAKTSIAGRSHFTLQRVRQGQWLGGHVRLRQKRDFQHFVFDRAQQG